MRHTVVNVMTEDSALVNQVERSVPSTVVRAETNKTDVDVDAIVKDLQEKVSSEQLKATLRYHVLFF